MIFERLFMTKKKSEKVNSVRKSSKPNCGVKKIARAVSPRKLSGWADPEEEGDYRSGLMDAAIGISRK